MEFGGEWLYRARAGTGTTKSPVEGDTKEGCKGSISQPISLG